MSYICRLAKARADTKYPERNITEKSLKELIRLAKKAIDARSQDRKPTENGNPESQTKPQPSSVILCFAFCCCCTSVNFVHRVMISFQLLMPSISLLVSSDDSEHILLSFN